MTTREVFHIGKIDIIAPKSLPTVRKKIKGMSVSMYEREFLISNGIH